MSAVAAMIFLNMIALLMAICDYGR
jgi:hypothetical protein